MWRRCRRVGGGLQAVCLARGTGQDGIRKGVGRHVQKGLLDVAALPRDMGGWVGGWVGMYGGLVLAGCGCAGWDHGNMRTRGQQCSHRSSMDRC